MAGQVAKRNATVNSRRRFQSGSLFKRGKRKKVWVGRWWEPTLKPYGTLGHIRRSEVLGPVAEIPRRQAQILLSQRLQSINQGTFRPKSQVTFREFVLDQFEPTMLPTLKYSTQRNYRHMFRRHLLPALGHRRLCDIQRVQLQRFIIEKLQQDFSWQTAAHIKNTLSKVLGVAVTWGYIEDNPARGIKLPPRQLKRERKFLTPEQVQRLFAALPEPGRTIVLVAVLSGLRIGEILALRWKRMDLLSGVIRIRESVYEGRFSTPKTASSRRDLPMAENLKQALITHRSRVRNGGPEDLVFGTKRGTALRSKNLQRRVLLPACDKARIPRIGWHAFRHTHATLLSMLGESLKTAQAQLGHSSLQTTLEVYTHPIPETQRAAVERLEHLLMDPNGPKFGIATSEGSGKGSMKSGG